MFSHSGIDDLGRRLHATRERFDAKMMSANQEVAALSVEAESADGGIVVHMRGDFSVDSIKIDEDAYEEYTEDSLADSIIEAFYTAVKLVSRGQRHAVIQGSKE